MTELMKIREIAPIKVACIDGKGPYNEMGVLFKELYDWIKEKGISTADIPGIALEYDNPMEVGPANCRYTICVPIKGEARGNDRIKIQTLPKARAACLLHKGPYSQLSEKWQAAMQWVQENGYMIADVPREAYLNDCWGTPESELLTEIQIPVG